VRVRVGAIDLLTLDVAASVVAQLDAAAATVSDEATGGDDEEGDSAGPIAIAIDVASPDAAVDADPVAAAPA
jgi:exoribonuclease-2